MFRTRATFLYLFLAVAFNRKVSGTTHTEFGCEFDDKDYNLKRKHREQPAWSNVTMESNNDMNNSLAIEFIEEPFKKLFSEASILNELSLFTEYVTKYKNKSDGTFKSFFYDYVVPIEPEKKYCDPEETIRHIRDPASYLIQELHSFSLTFYDISPYFVSAYVDRVVEFKDISPSKAQDIWKLLQRSVQDHLAAIIKIRRDGRPGYILIDPGYANGEKLYQPLVMYVMEDGKHPHGEILSGPERKSQIGAVIHIVVGDGKEEYPFILVEHNLPKVVHVLYYVGKPYCSFMENTIKLNLMRQYHGILQRDNKGDPQTYLRFKITPKTKNFRTTIFRHDTNDVPTTTGTVDNAQDDRTRGLFLVPDTEVSLINRQLKVVEEDVLSDKQFLAKLIDLTKGLDTEPGDESAISLFLTKSKMFLQKITSCLKPKTNE